MFKATLKQFFKDLFAFLKSKIFFTNLLIAIFAFVVMLVTINIFAGLYTHHGQKFSVPNFKGLTVDKAIEKANDKDLKIEIIDSVYNAPGKKGTIIDQTPPPNFKVKQNRTIFVIIKATVPEMIKMPNLRGVSIIQAKSDLEANGLLIGRLIYKPDIATNNVLDQKVDGKSISPGTIIEKGTKIDLVLGLSEEGGNTNAPDLIGLTEDQATQIAAENSLNIGTAIYDETVKTEQDSLEARVWKQTPGKKAALRIGGQIDIWLTLDGDLIDKK